MINFFKYKYHCTSPSFTSKLNKSIDVIMDQFFVFFWDNQDDEDRTDHLITCHA